MFISNGQGSFAILMGHTKIVVITRVFDNMLWL